MDKKFTKSSFIVLILTALIVVIESAPAPINHAEVSLFFIIYNSLNIAESRFPFLATIHQQITNNYSLHLLSAFCCI